MGRQAAGVLLLQRHWTVDLFAEQTTSTTITSIQGMSPGKVSPQKEKERDRESPEINPPELCRRMQIREQQADTRGQINPTSREPESIAGRVRKSWPLW